jgi:hypothetical protein
MKFTVCFIMTVLAQITMLFACPVCEKNQPAVLKGITHGTGPQNNWDYVIVIAAVILVLYTLFYTVKLIIRPGEKDNNHIKRTVIN